MKDAGAIVLKTLVKNFSFEKSHIKPIGNTTKKANMTSAKIISIHPIYAVYLPIRLSKCDIAYTHSPYRYSA